MRYETAGFVDETVVREIAPALVSNRERAGYCTLAALCVLLAALSLCLRQPLAFILCGILAVWYGASLFQLPRRYARAALLRLRETENDQPDSSAFSETGAHISPSGALIRYAHFQRLAVTPHTFVLFTRGNQFLVVFKDQLAPAEQSGFLSFIREKCPGISIRYIYKTERGDNRV